MRNKIWLLGLVLLLMLALTSCSGKENSLKEEGLVKLPQDEITKEVKKFDYDAGGLEVTYFAVLGPDGKVRTAFDACDVCGGKKGYSQKRKTVVCNNCGTVFKIGDLGTKNKGGGCWPSYLSHEIKDGYVIIQESELENGKFRFI